VKSQQATTFTLFGLAQHEQKDSSGLNTINVRPFKKDEAWLEALNAPATIIFDGICNLCNQSVRFIMANDPWANFRFAARQSEAGAAAILAAGRDPASIESIVLIDDEGLHERSDAALRIAAGLRYPWPAFRLLRAVPTRLRDAVYDAIARNRYAWFGRRSTCAVPTAAQRARFL
jgi:predicted DCC family thiol-disulfide oxidoreductase YuxK